MLECDLNQDIYLNAEAGMQAEIGAPLTLKTKIASDRHFNYFFTGSFTKQNETLKTKTRLYKTKNSKLQAERSFSAPDLFKLVDSMSLQLKYDLEIPAHHIKETADLPVSERFTNSISALRMYFTMDYEKAIKEDTTFAYAYVVLKRIYEQNMPEKVERALSGAMRHSYKLPERDQFKIKYDYYAMKEDADKQLAVAKMWVELYPHDIQAHAFLAEVYQLRNQLDEAILEYKRILELDPEQYDYLQKIGSAYKRKGQFDEALEYYKKYADQFPTDYESFTAIGDLYKTMGIYEQAKTNYEKALLFEPEEVSVLLSLADIEVKRGNFAPAIEQYLEALKISKIPPERVNVYDALTNFYELRGEMRKSLEYFHKYLAEQENYWPPFIIAFNTLGRIDKYIEAGEIDVAFQTIKKIEPQLKPPYDREIPVGYLKIYLALGDADNAEKALTQIRPILSTTLLRMHSSEGQNLASQGQIHELRDEYKQAIQSYQKGLELNPTYSEYIMHIGRCYRKLNEYEKAEESLEKYLKVEPFNPKAHYELALVYHDMGKKEKAFEHLKKALHVWEEADPEYKPAKKAREKLAEWEAVTEKM
jgi:tetratricopeptide (TPR) repeat protein